MSIRFINKVQLIQQQINRLDAFYNGQTTILEARARYEGPRANVNKPTKGPQNSQYAIARG